VLDTKRQREWNDDRLIRLCMWVDIYLEQNRFAPSIREIALYLDLRSSSDAHQIVARCIDRGWLAQLPSRPRTLHTTEAFRNRKEEAA
jgi:SOS-response transcriptional repressor LexA